MIPGSPGSISGIGVDLVDVARFHSLLNRRPNAAARLFCANELCTSTGQPRSAASLAARFAAKEAVAKALAAPAGLEWHDCEVVMRADGSPTVVVTGTVLAAADQRGVTDWHLTMSHDGAYAIAYVVAESRRV
ncbi:MAG: holo-ACP synthase [Candidatus Nanopelagicales bacterium]|jgi:holo-[acyl-carrier protein] synthase